MAAKLDKNKKARYKWALKYKSFTEEDWSNIVWSDESNFENDSHLICETAVSRKQTYIFCGGPCKKVVHVSCVYAGTVDLPTLIKQIPELSWRCNDCLSSDVFIEDAELGQLVESKISHALDSIVVQINELKSTIEQAVLQNPDASSVNKPIPYASVLRKKTVPAVIIKPKTRYVKNED
ncbi:unnamed protein product [Acanthoscelides obtectus]|uniref:Uncharacterized protein n=1 Tax=Acanthoscelides obtectus TaxID=200917 RepID=A0A9P0K4S2_ACAOB|nr:unnamed protein product [Acanthoscelides obtectus]CAK1634224.1 hypothetical protein AOBTE_LOCUS8676 [Acanthoscelides obtectus]